MIAPARGAAAHENQERRSRQPQSATPPIASSEVTPGSGMGVKSMTRDGRPEVFSLEAKRRAVLPVLSDWLSSSQPKLLAGSFSQFCASATMLAVEAKV